MASDAVVGQQHHHWGNTYTLQGQTQSMSQAERDGLDGIEALAGRQKFPKFINWLARQDPDEKFYVSEMARGSGLSRNTLGRNYVENAVELGILEHDRVFYRVNQDSPVLQALREADEAIREEADLDELEW